MVRNMRQDAPRETEIGAERETFGDLLSRLATASAGLVRDEIGLAKQEAREKIKSLRTGLILWAVAALMGIVALFTLNAALVIAVGTFIGFGLSALAVGIAILIIAGIFFGLGFSRLRKTKLRPEETIRSLKEDREWLKKIT
ncbi:MAG: hypothetical protein H6Q07_2714 [Acidobacteria bacterium]|nr:hypothetical protein [Acidobacteriota bacterium]